MVARASLATYVSRLDIMAPEMFSASSRHCTMGNRTSAIVVKAIRPNIDVDAKRESRHIHSGITRRQPDFLRKVEVHEDSPYLHVQGSKFGNPNNVPTKSVYLSVACRHADRPFSSWFLAFITGKGIDSNTDNSIHA